MSRIIPIGVRWVKGYAFVDEDIYDYLVQFPWSPNGNVTGAPWNIYALRSRSLRWTAITMHRLIFAHDEITIAQGMVVDHINGQRNDNRRSNLRIVTPLENSRNRSLPRYHIPQEIDP